MVEESSPLVPPAEESIQKETNTAVEPQTELAEPAPEPASEPGFVCDCEGWMRSACKGLPYYQENENRRYCALHYPGKEKSAEFKAALNSKLNKQDFNFRGVWFPHEADFSFFEFSTAADFSSAVFGADADFESATFSADADFRSATFSKDTYFSEATFIVGANFSSATFSAAAYFFAATFSEDTYFSEARFGAETYFSGATFDAYADFSETAFSATAHFNLSVFHARADFSRASFNDSIGFFGSAIERLLKDDTRLAARVLGNDPSLDFQHVRTEHPERTAFHTLNLRPNWFVNVDSREFVFTDVGWEWELLSIKEEIAALEGNKVPSPNRLLVIACRQLAENAEANNRYEEASRFRYWAMDLARRTKWNGWSFWKTDCCICSTGP